MLATVLVPTTSLGGRKSTSGRRAVLVNKRIDGDPDADRDGAAQVFAVLGNHVEVDGGAEVHDDARAAVFVEAGDAVHQPVGAHFVGIVVADGEPDIGARLTNMASVRK